MVSKISPLLLTGALLILSCNGDEPIQQNYEQEQLFGRWELTKGWRNGKQTETMTGTYYEFNSEGIMKTNLTPTATEQNYEYVFSGKEIKQKSNPPIIFTVDTLTEHSLAMRMVINKFPFRLELAKALPPTEPEPTDSSLLNGPAEL